jgi:aryl-alcohol dehydrogenase-like predicted oxidoreductase
MDQDHGSKPRLSRRQFLITSGTAAAATTVLGGATSADESPEAPRISRYRTLGRTGFEVSDISFGGSGREANLYRYAYDHGINYFDTAEGYANGDNERLIGEALQHMDRKKVFVTTKLEIKDEDTEQTILDRFAKCQERLRTDYVDALFMHSVPKVSDLDNPHFHAAVRRLTTDGRLRFAGVSKHEARSNDEDSMDDVLVAAAEDGRFALMLIAYNFMNRDKGDRVLAACRKNDVGTTAMKTAPGTVKMEPLDPDNPSDRYSRYIENQIEAGETREKAIQQIEEYIQDSEKRFAEAQPFMEKHGITDREGLKQAAVQWVLSKPEMQTVCMGFRDFDSIERFLPLSGTTLTQARAHALEGYRVAASSLYCRHACNDCSGACPQAVPVSTVMRYAYYFTEQGREKHAMGKYRRLGWGDTLPCDACSAPCDGACPHGVNIKANLIAAHGLLTLA